MAKFSVSKQTKITSSMMVDDQSLTTWIAISAGQFFGESVNTRTDIWKGYGIQIVLFR